MTRPRVWQARAGAAASVLDQAHAARADLPGRAERRRRHRRRVADAAALGTRSHLALFPLSPVPTWASACSCSGCSCRRSARYAAADFKLGCGRAHRRVNRGVATSAAGRARNLFRSLSALAPGRADIARNEATSFRFKSCPHLRRNLPHPPQRPGPHLPRNLPHPPPRPARSRRQSAAPHPPIHPGPPPALRRARAASSSARRCRGSSPRSSS